MSFFETEPGTYQLDFVPFIVGKGNPFADPGQLHFERTFWTYNKIGPDEKKYVCSSKTFGKTDFIQEYRQREAKNPKADPDYLQALAPKERQIFLVYDRKNPEKGIQLWESSYHTFGKLLDARIKASPEERGWDLFYYPDEDGFTLEVTFAKKSGGTFEFLDTLSIDFIPRKSDLPDSIVNHGFCPDDFLVETPYETLKKVFLGVVDEAPATEDPKSERKEECREEKNGAKDDVPFDKGETEDPEAAKKRQYSAGGEAFKNKMKRSDNPFKKESYSYAAWQDGWLDAAEKFEQSPKKEEKKEVTATTLGVKKDDEILYKGSKHTVVRISEDGKVLTLIDKDDEIVKGVAVADIQKNGEAPKQETKKEELKVASEKKESPKSEKKDEEKSWDSDW